MVTLLPRKSIDFESEDAYLALKAEATLQKKSIGQFIIQCFEFWKNEQKKEDKQ